MSDETPYRREIKSFGRRDSRPLSSRQKSLMESLLPDLCIPTETGVDLDAIFGAKKASYWLEIGFGGGEHLIRRAKERPDVGLVGAEPFIDGVAKALTGVSDNGLQNVRFHPDDVRDILPNFAAGCFERAFILFPDPWPKRRQQKRRLIQTPLLDDLARILKPGARLRFATDVSSYADEALARFMLHDQFAWDAETQADWLTQPGDHEATRYQLKSLGDCAPIWLEFTRK